jgi:hypothetical protein
MFCPIGNPKFWVYKFPLNEIHLDYSIFCDFKDLATTYQFEQIIKGHTQITDHSATFTNGIYK